ncbi:MAG: prolipoprotein diacylglyceryl transferase [Sphaerospermopsis sp. SIO1G2]|nr:prolipoprotein diacylglyceryl transferase [Sphaerospermopsis sp. SIO1G2]
MITTLALAFPTIDPVALEIGPFLIRWYALAYIAGIMGAWWMIDWLDRTCTPTPLLTKKQRDDMVMWGVIGIVLGGRIGYVLFYNLHYFLENLTDSIKIWQGGMSFHGGALGVVVSFYLFSRLHNLPYRTLMDRICCAVPIGLFFGRIANFVNGELYGRVTDVSWSIIFPHGGPLPRHPSQLYEAFFEGAVLFCLLLYLATKTSALKKPGLLSGVFLAGYGLARASIEFFREPDAHIGFIIGSFSMGQLLCLPMMLIGSALIVSALRTDHKQRTT